MIIALKSIRISLYRPHPASEFGADNHDQYHQHFPTVQQHGKMAVFS